MNVVADLMVEEPRQRNVANDSKAQPASPPTFFEVVDQERNLCWFTFPGLGVVPETLAQSELGLAESSAIAFFPRERLHIGEYNAV